MRRSAIRKGERAAVKLTPAVQATYLAAGPNAFFLAKGDRGKKGWTIVELAEAKSEVLRGAILLQAVRLLESRL